MIKTSSDGVRLQIHCSSKVFNLAAYDVSVDRHVSYCIVYYATVICIILLQYGRRLVELIHVLDVLYSGLGHIHFYNEDNMTYDFYGP